MLEGVKGPLQTCIKNLSLTPSENFILSEGLLHESDTRKKMPFCLLMNKLNIITRVLFLPLMEGL